MNHEYLSSQFKLRHFVKNFDEETLFQAIGGAQVTKHMATENISLEDCRTIVGEAIVHWQIHGVGSWAVEVAGKTAGWAGFKLWKNQEYELLIVLSPNHWGLGKCVFHKLLRIGFEDFNLNQLIVLLPETRKSTHYIKRAGFEMIGKEMFNGEPFKKFCLNPETSTTSIK